MVTANTLPIPERTEDENNRDLWKQALTSLSAEDQQQYKECSLSMLNVLGEVCNQEMVPFLCNATSISQFGRSYLVCH